MKHFFAYCFILLILLNVVGYNGLFFGLQYENSMAMRDKFDRGDYRNETSVELKIPLALPYAYDRLDFDRIDGSFEFNGELYRLVEKRLKDDTLTVVCVVDHQYRRISEVFEDYVRTLHDHPADHGTGTHIVSLIKDYLSFKFDIQRSTDGWCTEVSYYSLACIHSHPVLAEISIPPEHRL